MAYAERKGRESGATGCTEWAISRGAGASPNDRTSGIQNG